MSVSTSDSIGANNSLVPSAGFSFMKSFLFWAIIIFVLWMWGGKIFVAAGAVAGVVSTGVRAASRRVTAKKQQVTMRLEAPKAPLGFGAGFAPSESQTFP